MPRHKWAENGRRGKVTELSDEGPDSCDLCHALVLVVVIGWMLADREPLFAKGGHGGTGMEDTIILTPTGGYGIRLFKARTRA